MAGKPTLDKDLIESIAALVRVCNYPTVAARRLGIAKRTFARWTAKGKADALANEDTVYAQLVNAIDTADATAESVLLGAYTKMTINDPRKLMELAERRWPSRWGKHREKHPEDPKAALEDFMALIHSRHFEMVNGNGDTSTDDIEE